MSAHGCDRRLAPRDTPVAAARFDEVEQTLLTVARYYFQSFAHPATEAWVKAFALAEERFPSSAAQTKASELAVALLAAVQAMRASRKSGFRFSNPDCPDCARILCEQERQFMEVLRALRQDARSRAHASALLLCEGNPTTAFLRAMTDLVALTGDRHPFPVRPNGPQMDRGPAVP